jgi:hypothetical protein
MLSDLSNGRRAQMLNGFQRIEAAREAIRSDGGMPSFAPQAIRGIRYGAKSKTLEWNLICPDAQVCLAFRAKGNESPRRTH